MKRGGHINAGDRLTVEREILRLLDEAKALAKDLKSIKGDIRPEFFLKLERVLNRKLGRAQYLLKKAGGSR